MTTSIWTARHTGGVVMTTTLAPNVQAFMDQARTVVQGLALSHPPSPAVYSALAGIERAVLGLAVIASNCQDDHRLFMIGENETATTPPDPPWHFVSTGAFTWCTACWKDACPHIDEMQRLPRDPEK